jgi:glycosyltransferase involved in cell wall biosynthesis
VSSLLHSNIRYVLFCQFNSDHLGISPSERAGVRAVLARSNSCIFLSRRNLEETRRQFALDPPRAVIVDNPIRDGADATLPWPSMDSCVRFASVARFETAWKGQDMLLDVLARPAWRGRSWHLTFYGSGQDLEHLKTLVGFFGLTDRITFAGFVSSVQDIWKDNHALLLPSHGEGLPLAALEAMMLGRPVVATDVGGNRELIREGANGFIADGSTARSFGEALERAWQMRHNWPAMGEQAHFTVADMAKRNPSRQLLDQWLSAATCTRRS